MGNAAEYLLTQAQAVLFTNENTVIRLDADENSAVIASGVEEGLPIQVTGVTYTGYFKILLDGQTLYVHGIGLTAGELVFADTGAPNDIYDKMIAHKAIFAEGLKWTHDNHYRCKGAIYSGGFDCAAYAFGETAAPFNNVRATFRQEDSNIETLICTTEDN